MKDFLIWLIYFLGENKLFTCVVTVLGMVLIGMARGTIKFEGGKTK